MMSTVSNNSSSVQSNREKFSEDEVRGLELIKEEGSIHQSNFWKELDISSRKGSRIVKILIKEDMIEREEAVYKGHNTYLLKPKYKAENLDFSLLMAGKMISPFIGDEEIDAMSDEFTDWIINLEK